MLLTGKILNEDATLNNFVLSSSARMARGSSAKIIIQLIQPAKNLRYIPDSGATITLALLKSDGTTLVKTATNPFADDRPLVS